MWKFYQAIFANGFLTFKSFCQIVHVCYMYLQVFLLEILNVFSVKPLVLNQAVSIPDRTLIPCVDGRHRQLLMRYVCTNRGLLLEKGGVGGCASECFTAVHLCVSLSPDNASIHGWVCVARFPLECSLPAAPPSFRPLKCTCVCALHFYVADARLIFGLRRTKASKRTSGQRRADNSTSRANTPRSQHHQSTCALWREKSYGYTRNNIIYTYLQKTCFFFLGL